MEANNLAEVTRWGKLQPGGCAIQVLRPTTSAFWPHWRPMPMRTAFVSHPRPPSLGGSNGAVRGSTASLPNWLKPAYRKGVAHTHKWRHHIVPLSSPRGGAFTSERCPPADRGCHVDDSPCQEPDTNQHNSKHNQVPPHCAPLHDGSSQSSPMPSTADIVDLDWQPSPAIIQRALGLYPNLDVAEHTTLFVSRCRGKGYSVRRGGEDDIWLAWLIEDRRKASISAARLDTTGRNGPAHRPWQSKDARTNRFAAWGLAASHPTSL